MDAPVTKENNANRMLRRMGVIVNLCKGETWERNCGKRVGFSSHENNQKQAVEVTGSPRARGAVACNEGGSKDAGERGLEDAAPKRALSHDA